MWFFRAARLEKQAVYGDASMRHPCRKDAYQPVLGWYPLVLERAAGKITFFSRRLEKTENYSENKALPPP